MIFLVWKSHALKFGAFVHANYKIDPNNIFNA